MKVNNHSGSHSQWTFKLRWIWFSSPRSLFCLPQFMDNAVTIRVTIRLGNCRPAFLHALFSLIFLTASEVCEYFNVRYQLFWLRCLNRNIRFSQKLWTILESGILLCANTVSDVIILTSGSRNLCQQGVETCCYVRSPSVVLNSFFGFSFFVS